MDKPAIDELRALLKKEGLCAGLVFLNKRVSYRFTSLYQLKDGLLHKRCLVDKRGGTGLPYLETVELKNSLTRFAIEQGEFETSDSMSDPRLADYRHLGMVGSCFSVRLVDADGHVWGTVSHFDMINRTMPADEASLFRQVPELLPPLLSTFAR